MEGLSLKTIGNKFGVSKEAVRQWMLKFEEAFAGRPLSKVKERPVIPLDETKVKRDGKELMVCPSAVLDLSQREVIAVQRFRSRSSFSAIAVMDQALKLCESKKPIVLVDHAPWYNWAFEGRFEGKILLIQITHGMRNYIERLYLMFKNRTKSFYNNFPNQRSKQGFRENIQIHASLRILVQSHAPTRERFHNTTPFSLS